jgi:hypothetical protein
VGEPVVVPRPIGDSFCDKHVCNLIVIFLILNNADSQPPSDKLPQCITYFVVCLFSAVCCWCVLICSVSETGRLCDRARLQREEKEATAFKVAVTC